MTKLNTIEDVNIIKNKYKMKVNTTYEYNDKVEKDKIISQSIKEGEVLTEGLKLDIVVSLGKLDKDKLASDNINELGKIPIMMYHGIRKKTSNSTGTIGGNVDKDGYNRTPDAFREDLEFYYEKGYQMIRLEDYINGKVDVDYGKSPIVLTFDDGNEDNIKVTGLDDNGNIIIDDFNTACMIYHNIVRIDISVNNVVLMKRFQTVAYRRDNRGGLSFCK